MAKTVEEKITNLTDKIAKLNEQIATEEIAIIKSKEKIKKLKKEVKSVKDKLEKNEQQKIIEALKELDIKSVDDLNVLLNNSSFPDGAKPQS